MELHRWEAPSHQLEQAWDILAEVHQHNSEKSRQFQLSIQFQRMFYQCEWHRQKQLQNIEINEQEITDFIQIFSPSLAERPV